MNHLSLPLSGSTVKNWFLNLTRKQNPNSKILRNHSNHIALSIKIETLIQKSLIFSIFLSIIWIGFEMSSDSPAAGDGGEQAAAGTSVPSPSYDKQKEKARVSRTSLILWHAHQNDAAAVRKLLEEDPTLVHARDYDKRTPLHVASLHGWIDVVKCLLEFGADVNAQDRWKNTVKPLPFYFEFWVASSSFLTLLWFWSKTYCCICGYLQPLADAEGARKQKMIELLKSHGGLSYVSFWIPFSDLCIALG